MAHLHSIYLTGGGKEPLELPWQIARNIESFCHFHPGFEHQLYRDENGRDFVERYFDADVLAAYDDLIPLAYKSDLLRLCLMYQLGGIYADLSVHFFAPLETEPGAPLVKLFRDRFNKAPWLCCNGLIYSPAGVDLFEASIRRIVENVRTGYHGYTALCPTGPNMFGAEVAKWGRLDAMLLGEAVAIEHTNAGSVAGYAYVAADHSLVGLINKTRSGLAALGSETQNNYYEFYELGKIYRADLAIPNVWTHRDYRDRAALTAKAIIDAERGRYRFPQGCALNGPFVNLGAGEYQARFVFGGELAGSAAKPVLIDVCALGPVRICEPQKVAPVPCGDGFEYTLSFAFDRRYENVQVRLFLTEAQELTFDRMELLWKSLGVPS